MVTNGDVSRYNPTPLPAGAKEYLCKDHPRFKELEEAYFACDQNVIKPLFWTEDNVKDEEILHFRGDNAYAWQLRGDNMNPLGYALSTYYVKAIDKLRLLNRLEEDEEFGIYTFFIDSKLISRDLLDSIIEIYFLERNLNISKWNSFSILDIGAGYGRLAHRVVSAFENIDIYLCADAICTSTFICEYYLNFRGIDGKAKVIPLPDIESELNNHNVDIAINIHSFSECTVSAIEWWLTQLEKNKIKYLMVVPNKVDRNFNMLTNDNKDFSKIVEKHGYKLISREPKFLDPIVQEYGISPIYHYLFELK